MKKLLTLLLLIAGLGSVAQQDALYSQYMFNMMVINPAYSGSRDVLSTTLVNRYQWVGFEGAPRTLSLSANTPLRNENIALGLYFYNNSLGPMRDWGIVTNYAYRLMLGESNVLSFGVDVGIRKLIIDWDQITARDEDDESIIDQPESQLKPDANFGIYFYGPQFYVGVSSKHLFENSLDAEDVNGSYTITTLARHFYFVGGYAYPVSQNFVLKPSTLVKYTINAPIQVDVNVSGLISNVLWLGISYRTKRNALVFLTEVNIGKNFRLGYSYDTYISQFSGQSQGSHEVMLNYEFDIYQLRMMRDVDVRYF